MIFRKNFDYGVIIVYVGNDEFVIRVGVGLILRRVIRFVMVVGVGRVEGSVVDEVV